jgi:hypothetical protein
VTTTAPKPAAPPTPDASSIVLIRQKINASVTLLSEIEQLVNKIEADNAQVNAIRLALKSLT